MKRLELSLIAGILVSIIFTSFGAFAAECEEIRGQVVRLHILANSDSDEDQALKLMVRDAILEQTVGIFSGDSKEQAELLVQNNLGRIENIARQVIDDQGFDYSVHAYLINMYFETRVYGNVTLAAGWYDAVRVEIGEAKGKNWWCVMFPPMCLPAASGEQQSDQLMQQIETLGQTPEYIPRFAILEWVEELKNGWTFICLN